jgi:hypothetical protein
MKILTLSCSRCTEDNIAAPKTPPMKKRRLSESEDVFPHHEYSGSIIEDDASDDSKRFRDYQSKQWDQSFDELSTFRSSRGHSQVPHGFKVNRSLSRWVKRQRYQYKLLQEGKPSTMTEDRIQRLEDVGFVWQSHNSSWERRVSELSEFQRLHGNVSVPTGYGNNPQLATWVKQQRRQYKLFCHGSSSNITLERIEQLQSMGFKWSLRTRREKA